MMATRACPPPPASTRLPFGSGPIPQRTRAPAPREDERLTLITPTGRPPRGAAFPRNGGAEPGSGVRADPDDVLRGGTLGALHDVELHGLALGEGLEALRLDGGEVDEQVPATLVFNEAEALGVVEPLHFSGRAGHLLLLLLRDSTRRRCGTSARSTFRGSRRARRVEFAPRGADVVGLPRPRGSARPAAPVHARIH